MIDKETILAQLDLFMSNNREQTKKVISHLYTLHTNNPCVSIGVPCLGMVCTECIFSDKNITQTLEIIPKDPERLIPYLLLEDYP